MRYFKNCISYTKVKHCITAATIPDWTLVRTKAMENTKISKDLCILNFLASIRLFCDGYDSKLNKKWHHQTSKFPFENVIIMFMRRFNELLKVSGNQIYRLPWNGTLMRSFVVRIKSQKRKITYQ